MLSTYLSSKLKEIEEGFIIVPYTQDSFGLCDDLINEEIAFIICNNSIDKQYIEDTFINKDINGYVLISNNDKYHGYIMFYRYDDYIEIVLVSTLRDDTTKGLPLGQYLLYFVEKNALSLGIKKLVAYSLPGAVDFYLKTGWEFCNKTEEDIYNLEDDEKIPDTYKIRKNINLNKIIIYRDILNNILDILKYFLTPSTYYSMFFNFNR